MRRQRHHLLAALGPLFAVVSLVLVSCSRSVPEGSLVLALSPRTRPAAPPRDLLESSYPAGSRIILAQVPIDPQRVRVLSAGLWAAGGPVLSYDGHCVYFAGKAQATSDWQIYQARLDGGRPRVLTSMPGGAMQPALLPDGSVVFASPVPKLIGGKPGIPVSALYAQKAGQKPHRLTFCPGSATDPSLLSDGRILFVYTPPAGSSHSGAASGLYTINNDGTEITAMAGQHEAPSMMARPRQLPDGHLVFLSSNSDHHCCMAETIRLARPFQSRAPLFPDGKASIRSVQPASGSSLLVCAELGGNSSVPCQSGIFRVNAGATTLGAPLYQDPAWDTCEAVEVAAQRRPMDRLSNMEPGEKTGQVLCLDANDTTYRSADASAVTARRIRVLAETAPGNVSSLGEVAVQADGSFMAELPADLPLGFEALDEHGQVVRRLEPMVWLRPGENRACTGCHAPHNRAPHNHRPLAVRVPVPKLVGEPPKLAQTAQHP